MKILEELINKLGISQRVLAKFLDADHSHLSRYKGNTRNISSEAQAILTNVYALVVALPTEQLPTPSEAETEELLQQAAWCQAQCQPLQKKLKAMQLQYQHASTIIQVIDMYKRNAGTLPEKKQRWLEEQQFQAEKKIGKNGWLSQRKLTIRIAVLKREATMCISETQKS